MNLIFCGTPQFAVPTLEKLLERKFTVELALTNPDEPAGRGYGVRVSAVKEFAQTAGLRLFQPAKLKDPETRSFLSSFQPDAIVVVAYGHIIPPWMMALPRLGTVNLHASLLPKYRGAAPIQWAIIRGERVTGVTTMMIDEGLDTGPILLSREEPIREDEVTETLSERLSVIGADLMVETLAGLASGAISPRPQDHASATLAPMLKKQDGEMDWTLSAEEISRRVRGLRPWPRATTTFRGKRLEIWMARPAPLRHASAVPERIEARVPGELRVENQKLLVVCGGGMKLEVRELQLEGRKRLSARDFLNGIRLRPGERFGS
jgi:methionyl-tRNA formyltransferase